MGDSRIGDKKVSGVGDRKGLIPLTRVRSEHCQDLLQLVQSLRLAS
jgi:hypothetical protein